MALVIAGTAAAVLSILVGVGALQVADTRGDRVAARSFAEATDPAKARAWIEVRRSPWRGEMVTRIDIAVADSGLAPSPGLESWPKVGEAAISPELSRLLPANTDLASHIQGEVAGQIGRAGLRAPDELLVYRGVPRSALPRGGMAVEATSDGPPFMLELEQGQVAALTAFFLSCLGLPLCGFLVVAARLSASTRSRRLAALRLLGLSVAQARVVNAVEIALLGVLGAVVGLLAYPSVNHVLAGSDLLGVRWFPQDTALTLGSVVGALLATPVLAVLVGSRSVRSALLTPFARRRSAPAAVPRRRNLIPLTLGLTGLITQVMVGYFRPAGSTTIIRLDLFLIASVLLTGIGLLLAVPPLTAWLGRHLAEHGRTVAVRLGGSRMSFDPASTGRLIAAILVFVFAVGVGIGHSRDARAATSPSAPIVQLTVDAVDVSPESRGRVLAVPGPRAAGFVVRTPPTVQGSVTALIADCRTMAAFVQLPFPSCDEQTSYLVREPGGEVTVPASIPLPTGEDEHTATVARPSQILPGFMAAGMEGIDIVLPPSAVTAIPAQAQFLFLVDRGRIDHTITAVLAVAPYAQPTAIGLDPDSAERIGMLGGYVGLAFLLGALVTLAAFMVAAVDRAVDRRPQDTTLLVLGVSTTLLRRAQMWEVGAPMAGGLVIAAVAGVLGGTAWQLTGALDGSLDVWANSALLFGAVAAALLATATSALVSTREIDPTLLRHE